MTKRLIQLVPFALAALLLAGCESAGDVKDDQAGMDQTTDQTATDGRQDQDGATTSGMQDGDTSGQLDPLDDPNSMLAGRIIYFEFDSARIAPEYEAILSAHAQHLAANSGLRVVLEGHADERGSREYNIALAEQRAKSVDQLFTIQGVTAEQTEVVSYGEERPAAIGHDDESWRLNRRVEIVYQGR
jgi:peptidoglycan-associated lipoprotein